MPAGSTPAPSGGPAAGTMDQVRPHMREQRFADCASLDWPTGPHPTLSGSGPAPTADRSKTPVAGLARVGLIPQGPLQKPGFLSAPQRRGSPVEEGSTQEVVGRTW